MDYMLQKLTSRKLWLAIAGVATGVYTVLGGGGGDISTVAGSVVSLASAIVYILVEGKIDAAAVDALTKGDKEEDA